MKYISTRGHSARLKFEQVVFAGLAPDGGFYVPDHVPTIPFSILETFQSMRFDEIAFEILSLFIDPNEIPRDDLRKIICDTLSKFDHPFITPLRHVDADQDLWILELFHGPSLSFKDFAMQFLGNLFDYFLQRKSIVERICIVGASNGDIGSAAVEGFKNKKHIELFLLHPLGKVSHVQEKQMTSVKEENIHNIAIKGSLDDCRDIVKGLFEDSHFRYSHKLAAINTVNWARIMIEIVYYFYAFFRIQEYHSSDLEIQHFRSVRFSIPSGSFGNALACYYAKLLGLPIHSIIVATNENDIMHRFLSKGIYEKNVLIETMSPAMDIQTASNFERFLFEITNRDSAFVNQSVHRMDVDRKIVLPPPIFNGIKEVFKSAAINQKQMLQTIRQFYFGKDIKRHSITKISKEYPIMATKAPILLDPHSAIGIAAAEKVLPSNPKSTKLGEFANFYAGEFFSDLKERGHEEGLFTTICLGTAHPIKFARAVLHALGRDLSFPRHMTVEESENFFESINQTPDNFKGLMQSESRYDVLEKSVVSVKRYIHQKFLTGAHL